MRVQLHTFSERTSLGKRVEPSATCRFHHHVFLQRIRFCKTKNIKKYSKHKSKLVTYNEAWSGSQPYYQTQCEECHLWRHEYGLTMRQPFFWEWCIKPSVWASTNMPDESCRIERARHWLSSAYSWPIDTRIENWQNGLKNITLKTFVQCICAL